MLQTHRSPLQRLTYKRLYRCPACATHMARPRAWLGALASLTLPFAFTLQTRCVKCRSPRVRRLIRRDRVDTVAWHPLSLLLRLLGAPLYRCDGCRVQYYDWRRLDREAE